MPWARLDDKAGSHPKLLVLSDAAFRLWACGLIYAQSNLTDGVIHTHAPQTFGLRQRPLARVIDELCQSLVPGKGPLWEPLPDGSGWQIHDFLDWNDSREQVMKQRQTSMQRITLFKNPALRSIVKTRDRGLCRYCARAVNWADRKGDLGATYDHVRPYGGNSEENLVVACRSCNSKKRGRTPEEARMPLLPVPTVPPVAALDLDPDLGISRSESRSSQTSTSTTTKILDQEQRAAGAPDDCYRVLLKLAHEVWSDIEQQTLKPGDVFEALKTRAAKAAIPYESGIITRALDAAQTARLLGRGGRRWAGQS